MTFKSPPTQFRLPTSRWIWLIHGVLGLLCLPLFVLVGSALVEGAQSFPGSKPAIGLSFVLSSALWQSVCLLIGVVLVCAVLGVSLAWLMAQYDFAGKKIFEWLLLAPLAVPSFVAAHAWVDLFAFGGGLHRAVQSLGWQGALPDIRSAFGASLILGFALYPYVYALSRVAFSAHSQRFGGVRAASSSLGATSWQSFWRVQLPLALPAVSAGLALVAMEALADYGAVAYLGVDTLTVSIYKVWLASDQRSLAMLMVVFLLFFVGILLAVQKRLHGQAQRFQAGQLAHLGAQSQGKLPRLKGRQNAFAALWCVVTFTLAFLVPLVCLAQALLFDPDSNLNQPQIWRLVQAVWHSIQIASLGALCVMGVALACAAARVSHTQTLWTRVLVDFLRLGYAVPGIAIAIALLLSVAALDHALSAVLTSIFGKPFGLFFLGSVGVLVFAYVLRFFAVAHNGVLQGVERLSPNAYHGALSLGSSRRQALGQIIWPNLRSSVGVGLLLAWIDCLKELPATLMLRPFDFDTLAVLTYQWVADERAAQAALPSLLLVLLGLVPVYILKMMQSSTKV